MTTFLSKYSLKIPVSRLVSFSKRICLYMRSFRSIKCKVKKRKNAKKNEDNCPAILTEQAWLIKDLLYAKKENRYYIYYYIYIPTRVANQNARFALSCPLADNGGFSHIIK